MSASGPMLTHALRTPDAKSRSHGPLPLMRVVQRKCGCGGTCGGCSDEKKKKVQRRGLGEMPSILPPAVERVLGTPGLPLDAGLRATMESRFGRPFGDVRVHTDSHAAASARQIQAAAYTSGTHIVFGDGRFDPSSFAGRHLLAHELAHVAQQRGGASLAEGIGPADDVHERAADRIADAVVAQGPAFAPPPLIAPASERWIRRQHDDSAAPEEARRLIVDDSATPSAGQMRRRELVDELDSAICATADQEMARLGQSTAGCPILAQYRPRLRAMNARTLETALRRWIDDLDSVRTARDYIPQVTRRLARSIALWGATGRIIGVPPDLMDLLGGGTIRVGVGSLLRGAVGGLFRKARDGAAAPASAAPVSLAQGQPLDGGAASRMGRAFGRDFSGVRVHTGADAAATASRMNARAFTVGQDIVFAGGEYAPGTIIGDALLAHELAHVAQQDGAAGPLAKSDDTSGALEQDADTAAAHAVASLWPGVRRFARGLRGNAMPQLKSSLRLQRCSSIPRITVNPHVTGGSTQASDVAAYGCTEAERGTPTTTPSGARPCCTPKMIREIRALHPEAIARVVNAIGMLAANRVGDFDDQLQAHFGVRASDTASVNRVRSNFNAILARMSSNTVEFNCRSQIRESYCRGRRARTAGCPYPAVLQFCGDYEESLPVGSIPGSDQTALPTSGLRGADSAFLFPRTEESSRTGRFNGWVRTLIHEYAHTVCLPPAAGGGPALLREGVESYRNQPGRAYPPADALSNPDSYSWFAMESSTL